MQLDLKDIFDAQIILDRSIHVKHDVLYNQVLDELKLALTVELAELANATRVFKFWSLKSPESRTDILEEYVDGVHFITSLSIIFKAKSKFTLLDDISILDKKNTTKYFNELFNMISLLKDATSIERWYQKYLILGYHLGFSFNDIYEAYFKKNQINFKRQQENY